MEPQCPTPHERASLRIIRNLMYGWDDGWCSDLECPVEGCDFQTYGPKGGGSGFVTLEMHLHLMGHSEEDLLASED